MLIYCAQQVVPAVVKLLTGVGLPVLTFAGTTMASRVSASLLHAMGLDMMVMHTEAAYEDTAVKVFLHIVSLEWI